ncbi:uncharacterized protein LOC120635597 isoform X2 [Pararge aegeria]|nr:uncharacterized protein LOC120635597 isoform X2 [Pararge aegeria]XP_039762543.1 uncharacterized protein LOC120635597 isoform X2 [Pararge aegeria]XP_039762544.1 uncharacterized protein LOC120635597 isoform X2 [Pararge aegeria]
MRGKILKGYQKDLPPNRRFAISLLRAHEGPGKMKAKQETPADAFSQKSEDNSMKIKLFRLMYETVRDSDLKVRRAELVKTQYTNSSVFEIGFLMGDVTDKMNVMHDISMTLAKLHEEWRPIEHINAYEQIANKAIEISHLLDVVRVIYKKVPIEHRPGAMEHGSKEFEAEK